jgi:phage-related minor tail protein
MARPTDWTPLGYATDPVPGDPEAVSRQAAHLGTVSQQITDQVAALRKIAAGATDGALVGQYADKIRSSASELAGQLDKVEGRYHEVSSALSGWVLDLVQAQAHSVTALNEAVVPYQKLLPRAVPPPSGSNLTAQQKQEVTDYHNSMNRAQSELNDAKALLARAVAFRDQQADHCATAINKAIDDGVKDSWWESHIEEFIQPDLVPARHCAVHGFPFATAGKLRRRRCSNRVKHSGELRVDLARAVA